MLVVYKNAPTTPTAYDEADTITVEEIRVKDKYSWIITTTMGPVIDGRRSVTVVDHTTTTYTGTDSTQDIAEWISKHIHYCKVTITIKGVEYQLSYGMSEDEIRMRNMYNKRY